MTEQKAAPAEDWQTSESEGSLLFLPLAHLLPLLNLDSLRRTSEPLYKGENDPHWQPYAEWRELLATGFKHPAARHYWQERLEEERTLACQVLPRIPATTERIRCFAESRLAEELGCPEARERLCNLLEQEADLPALLEHPLVLESRIADVHAVLIRLAAWRVVDLSLEHWEDLCQGGQQERVLLQCFLPNCDPLNGRWSNPLGQYLDHLARLSGCPENGNAHRHLAALWAGKGKHSIHGSLRLLGSWRKGRGRPQTSAVRELIEAVLQDILAGEEASGDPQLSARLLEESFRFAESCGYLQRTLSRHGVPDQVVAEIFAVYLPEYRKARAALGKPLADPA